MRPRPMYQVFLPAGVGAEPTTTRKKARRLVRGTQKRPSRGMSHKKGATT